MRQNYGMVTEMNERELQNVNGGIFPFIAWMVAGILASAGVIAVDQASKKKR